MEQLQNDCTTVEVDLKRERQLNSSLRESVAVQEALQVHKDAAVVVLEADAGPMEERRKPAEPGAEEGQGAEPEVHRLVQQLWRLPFTERVQLCNSVFRLTPPAQASLSLHSSDAQAAAFSLDIT